MKSLLDVISHNTRQNTLRTPEPKGASTVQCNILVAHRYTFAMHHTIAFTAFYRSHANRILANWAKLLRRLCNFHFPTLLSMLTQNMVELTDRVDISRPLLDDEDGSRIVLGVGVRLFTGDAWLTRSSRR